MPETLQLLTYAYVEDMAERRTPHREGHLAAIERSRAAGDLVIGGAAGDPPSTGLLAFRGGPEVAEAFAAADRTSRPASSSRGRSDRGRS